MKSTAPVGSIRRIERELDSELNESEFFKKVMDEIDNLPLGRTGLIRSSSQSSTSLRYELF